jgi:hypothetical protein
MTQSEAFEMALQQASKYSWKAVLNMMIEDGFDPKMDYVELLELWAVDCR